jgi:hypothetical protein
MYATLLAQPVGWVCSTRQTACTSAASDGYSAIFGYLVLAWSFHNPSGGAAQFAGGHLVLLLFSISTPASSARNVHVRRAYPRPVACRSGVPVGSDSCRSWPVVPSARIEAGHPCGTVATAPGCAVVPTARIAVGHPCGTVTMAPECAVVPVARIAAGHPCGTVATASGCAVVPIARIKAEPHTKI